MIVPTTERKDTETAGGKQSSLHMARVGLAAAALYLVV